MGEFKIEEIILVDDDTIVRLVVERILRCIGYTGKIFPFVNGFEAIESVKNQVETDSFTFSDNRKLILLDINMPIMNGWGFLNEFSKLPPQVKSEFIVSMITGSISEEDKSKAFSFPEVKDYIQKPLSEKYVLDFLSKFDLYEEK